MTMTLGRRVRRFAISAMTTLTVTGIAVVSVAAADGPARAGAAAAARAPQAAGAPQAARAPQAAGTTTVGYSCFVTFQGGSTTVAFSLDFGGSAPAQVAPLRPFHVVIDSPSITPSPLHNIWVQTVRVVFPLPPNAQLLGHWLSGGAGLAGSRTTLRAADGGLVLESSGPFPASVPFQLPSVNLLLRAGRSGPVTVSQGGRILSEPSFSWVHADPNGGTLRPFDCFVPAPVPLTSTAVTPGG